MTNQDRVSLIQRDIWTLELLGEMLVQHDELMECEPEPRLSMRNIIGIHQAIRTISRLCAEQIGRLER